MLEAKKNKGSTQSTGDSSSALTTTEDVGHEMDPANDGKHGRKSSEDQVDYAGLNETEDSV